MTKFTKLLLGAVSLAALTTAVHAADAVIENVPVAGYNWTGFYIGAHGGYAWANRDWDGESVGVPVEDERFNYDLSGALIGAQVGYNWQVNGFVFGVEADAAWSDVDDNATDTIIIPFIIDIPVSTQVEVEMDWLATIRGRVGYAWDRFLVYGTGGAAFAHVSTDVDQFIFGFPTGSDSASATHTGWAAGIGVEAMVTEKISVKFEYLHADFGDEDYDYNLIPLSSDDDSIGSADLDVDTIRLGVNFHF
jgi:outer membrane immunogenic protein